MKDTTVIPTLQAEALAREIERQLDGEAEAVVAAAETDGRAAIAQARKLARGRVHEAIMELRREGVRRLARAKAQLETERNVRAQRLLARAVADTLPLLRQMLEARWRDPVQRRQWTEALARLCPSRLRPGSWSIDHPPDWSEPERRDFAAAIGTTAGVAIDFKADAALTSGLRIKADQAMLDATPAGFLADDQAIAALILDEIAKD